MAKGILELLYTMEYGLEMHGILQMEFAKERWRMVVAGLFVVSISVYQGMVGFENNAALIVFFGKIIIAVLIFNESFGMVLVKFFFVFFYKNAIIQPIYIVFLILCRHIGINGREGFPMVLNECLQILTVIGVVVFLVGRENQRHWIRHIPIKYYIIGMFLGFCASGVLAISSLVMEEQPTAIRSFYEMLCLGLTECIYLFGIVLAFINELRVRYARENQIKNELLLMTEEHYQALDEKVQEVRKLRHDMKHHLGVVGQYLAQEEWERAQSYLREIDERMSVCYRPIYQVGNNLVDAVIADQAGRMPAQIDFRCEGALTENLRVANYDLCIVIANLLSNAREACERLEKQEPFISLKMEVNGDRTIIQCQNPIEWDFEEQKIGAVTSKADKNEHGFGLLNVREAVERYEGQLDFQKKDGILTVSVVL